ncbi:MAG TPA: recombinase family protein [Thermoplasmata archaeon]|nr:recombinase family protein [Thermoplasmata archaeon]
MTAAVYARVSTSEQSTSIQVLHLTNYCRSHGFGEPEVFADNGVSGIRDNRPELDRLRQRMRSGDLSAIVVTKMDRLGRSTQMILRFWDECEAAGVRIVVTDQGIDTSTPAGRFQRTMLAAMAEFERETILERTREGVERARTAGKRFGRPPKYSDAQRAETLRRLSAGESARKIAMALKMPASSVRWIGRQGREGGRRVESPPVGGSTTPPTTTAPPESSRPFPPPDSERNHQTESNAGVLALAAGRKRSAAYRPTDGGPIPSGELPSGRVIDGIPGILDRLRRRRR